MHKTFKNFNESEIVTENLKIADKDWNRMLSIVLTNKDGESVAKSIKDKNKSIARFVSGLKLKGINPNYDDKWKEYRGSFSDFGNKAITLGATPVEIQNVFDENSVPTKFSEKLTDLSDKKLNNRFVGSLSKAILDAGFNINYLSHNGNAITYEGKDAMERNGRKWTIGYKTEISVGDKKFRLDFDAITDEAIDNPPPTSYVIDTSSSDNIFGDIPNWKPIGIRRLITSVMNKLK